VVLSARRGVRHGRYGLGMASVFPCGVMQAEGFVDLSGRAVRVFLRVCGAFRCKRNERTDSGGAVCGGAVAVHGGVRAVRCGVLAVVFFHSRVVGCRRRRRRCCCCCLLAPACAHARVLMQASVLMIGSATGEMLIPLAVGVWTASWAPGFMVGICVSTLGFSALAGSLYMQGKHSIKHNSTLGRRDTAAPAAASGERELQLKVVTGAHDDDQEDGLLGVSSGGSSSSSRGGSDSDAESDSIGDEGVGEDDVVSDDEDDSGDGRAF
jgi:hypothetical protein